MDKAAVDLCERRNARILRAQVAWAWNEQCVVVSAVAGDIIRACIMAIVVFLCLRYRVSDKKKKERHRQNTVNSKMDQYRPCTITIYNRDGAELMRQPSAVVIDKQHMLLRAVGKDAVGYIKASAAVDETVREHYHVRLNDLLEGSPLRCGAVVDFEWARAMFAVFLRYSKIRQAFRRAKLAVCVPEDLTPNECERLREVLAAAGAKKVHVVVGAYRRTVLTIPPTYLFIMEISSDTGGW